MAMLLIEEELGQGATGIGGKVGQPRRIRGGRDDNGRMSKRSGLAQSVNHARDAPGRLPDGGIDTRPPAVLLMDDGVEGEGGLAESPVADEGDTRPAVQPARGVDHLGAGVEALARREEPANARPRVFHGPRRFRDGSGQPVEGPAERVEHPAQDSRAAGHFKQPAGAAHRVAGPQPLPATERGVHDRVFFQVQRHAGNTFTEYHRLARHAPGQPGDVSQAVGQSNDGPGRIEGLPASLGTSDLPEEVDQRLDGNMHREQPPPREGRWSPGPPCANPWRSVVIASTTYYGASRGVLPTPTLRHVRTNSPVPPRSREGTHLFCSTWSRQTPRVGKPMPR